MTCTEQLLEVIIEIAAINAEIEAMKTANIISLHKYGKLLYNENLFTDKVNEIRNVKNKLMLS
jgi:hypothetical protein